MQKYPELEAGFKRLVQAAPDVPENRDNLSSLEAVMGQTTDSIRDLRRALEENDKRLAANPKAYNLRAKLPNDQNFAPLTNSAEFQSLISAPR